MLRSSEASSTAGDHVGAAGAQTVVHLRKRILAFARTVYLRQLRPVPGLRRLRLGVRRRNLLPTTRLPPNNILYSPSSKPPDAAKQRGGEHRRRPCGSRRSTDGSSLAQAHPGIRQDRVSPSTPSSAWTPSTSIRGEEEEFTSDDEGGWKPH